MEQLPREELERLVFFEQAREQAEADWTANPRDAQALTRWGGALLELAHFRQGPEAVDYIELAVSKFEAALAIDSRRHDALWCLGNALTSQGFLFADRGEALEYFERARVCFQRAVDEEPDNEVYRKALEMTARAPALHAELQKQFAAQQGGGALGMSGGGGGGGHGGGSASGRRGGGSDAGGGSSGDAPDWVYDAAGWGILAALAVGWVALARAS